MPVERQLKDKAGDISGVETAASLCHHAGAYQGFDGTDCRLCCLEMLP